MPGGISCELLESSLHTIRLGRALRIVQEATSTIDLAWEWLRADGPEGGVVIAERQAAGRGRMGHAWASPAGGLWMSVITRPQAPADLAGRLGMAMAVAAAQGAKAVSGVAVRIKWPNDLVIGTRKLGGVLTETETQGGRITAAVLSLGLNVNVPAGALAGELMETAASLLEETGRHYSIEVIAASTLGGLEELLGDAYTAGPELGERWLGLDALYGREVQIMVGGELLTGVAAGISFTGGLVLETPSGMQTVGAGEVTSVRSVV